MEDHSTTDEPVEMMLSASEPTVYVEESLQVDPSMYPDESEMSDDLGVTPAIEPSPIDDASDDDLQDETVITPALPEASPVVAASATQYSISRKNYYSSFRWPQFSRWNLVRFDTPPDGSCLFHAIANAYFAPYHTETWDGKKITRDAIVRSMRKEFADKLGQKDPTDKEGRTYYDQLNNGNTKSFASSVPEFSLEHMKQTLDSNSQVGYGYMEFIGNIIDRDIYILSGHHRDVYNSDELRYTIRGDRSSLVLFFASHHYELVGVKNDDDSFSTHFKPTHSFIQNLYQRVQFLINNAVS
jgi:hypothetical protein